MNPGQGGARRKAAGAAARLLLAGGLLGVLVDRLWLVPREAEAAPLTVQALAERLGLSASEEARIRALLDTMHNEITAAAQHGSEPGEREMPVRARTGWRQQQHVGRLEIATSAGAMTSRARS